MLVRTDILQKTVVGCPRSLEQARLNVDSTTYLRPQAVLFGCLFFHKVSASFLTEYILVLFTNDVETNAVVDCLLFLFKFAVFYR